MANWHVAGVRRGTKSNIIYHSIMAILYSILSIIVLGLFIYTWLEKEFHIEILLSSFIMFVLMMMHKMGVQDCTMEYVRTADYRFASKSPTKIDKLIIKLVNHYNKKWVPAPYICCSLTNLDPEVAYKSLDLSLIADYGKCFRNSDTHRFLYQCNKCKKYVFSVESKDFNQSVYIPIKSKEEADANYKKLGLYSIRTLRPLLHCYDDFYTWEHKDYTGDSTDIL